MKGPLARYRALVEDGALEADAAQAAAAARLDALSRALESERRSPFQLFRDRKAPPKGVYLWGGVGRGKSLLMDIFFNNTEIEPKRRVHFHEFMAETHERIAAFRALGERERRAAPGVNRAATDDPMPPVAEAVAREARLLCFDEFQVSDIADAMILGRLFEALFARRVVIVATSNRNPDDLYRDGINRQLFLPFIAMLKERLDVIKLDAKRDFRLGQLGGAPVYYAPLGPATDAAMDRAWSQLIAGARQRAETLTVKGRKIAAPRTARGIARFTFAELCEAPLGAIDYLAIVRRYSALFIDHIPRMTAENRNEAKRFVTLIDAIYETRTKLICSADAPPDALYTTGEGAFEFERTASRLYEMQSADYLGAEHEVPDA